MEFIKFLEQELEQQTPEIRLNMITALGKLGHIESVKVLSKIISKKALSPMVRSLAVYGLKKIAVRTWFEPSKEVASFIYTTFHALSRNEIPELKILSEKIVPLLTLVKPFELGLQYSKHLHDTTFVKYLDVIVPLL